MLQRDCAADSATPVSLAPRGLRTWQAVAVAAVSGAPTGRVRRTITGRNQRGDVIATIEEEREVPRRR